MSDKEKDAERKLQVDVSLIAKKMWSMPSRQDLPRSRAKRRPSALHITRHADGWRAAVTCIIEALRSNDTLLPPDTFLEHHLSLAHIADTTMDPP